MHTNYQPNEVEQQYIAAGVLKLEDVDPEYKSYLHNRPRHDDEFLSYDEWVRLRSRWNELNAEYERDIEPVYKHSNNAELTREQRDQEEYLLREMTYIETALGY